MHGLVLVLWRVAAILENGCGIQGKKMLQYFKGVKCKQGLSTGISMYMV